MWKVYVLAVLAVGLYGAPSMVHATLPGGVCEVVVCDDGKVFCSPATNGAETPEGSAAGPMMKVCKGSIVDAPCSEVPICGRRVPTVSVVGLVLLGLGMCGLGLLFVRRRQGGVTPGTP